MRTAKRGLNRIWCLAGVPRHGGHYASRLRRSAPAAVSFSLLTSWPLPATLPDVKSDPTTRAIDGAVGTGNGAPRGYPGGKGGAGVYQFIINQMPPHKFYLEPFLGSGTVMLHKRPATSDFGVDINDATTSEARRVFAGRKSAQFITGGALGLLESVAAQLTINEIRKSQLTTTAGASSRNHPRSSVAIPAAASSRIQEAGILPSNRTAADVVVYCDPPYLKSTRRSQNRLYEFEPGTDAVNDDAWHTRLLNVLNALPCYVLLSGYYSDLYEKLLPQSHWRALTYKAITRSGRMATEYLWCNFPEPLQLHDYRYLGRDKRERQRIRRKVERWRARWSGMATLERQAILAAIQTQNGGDHLPQ